MEPGIFFPRAGWASGPVPVTHAFQEPSVGAFSPSVVPAPRGGCQAPGYVEGWGISQETLGFSPV